MRSYLIYGSSAWDEPWLTEHNLAHALSARGNEVLFVEPPVSFATPLRPGAHRNARRLLRRGVRREGATAVVQPLALPPLSHPRARSLSVPLVLHAVRTASRRLDLAEQVVISTRNTAALAGVTDEALRVYLVKDWVRAGGDLLGRRESDLERDVATMARWADLVCAISPQLQDGLARDGVDSVVLRHGFHAELVPLYEGWTEPGDLKRLPRPLLGYAGRIDARLDIDLLVRLARRFDGGTLLLIGPVSPRLPADERARLEAEPNVLLLGTRARTELPAYLSSLDCSLMPYRKREWLNYGSPLKLWDLLYAGPPIVGCGCIALAEYSPELLEFAAAGDEFLTAVARALDTGRQGEDARRRYALANSWDARAAQLEQMVAGRVA